VAAILGLDLSINNNNSGSLTNGPTFSAANGGVILFDGGARIGANQ
jgi:hypothetical protein